MRDLVVLFIHFIATLARLLRPGGARSIVAESLLLKHQLLILNRSRQRAPEALNPARPSPSHVQAKNTACCSHPITIASPARRDQAIENMAERVGFDYRRLAQVPMNTTLGA
jgi:hypothetical protein